MTNAKRDSKAGPWDIAALETLSKWDPPWAAACLKVTNNPWTAGILPGRFVELVGAAVDAALFVLNERVILGQRGISLPLQGFAVLNALILAKVMLIADYFDLGAWLRRRPLIYPIVASSLFLTVLFIGFHVIEKVVIGLVHGESVAQSVPAIGGGGFVGVLCVALILFVSLIPFFAFRFVGRELGAGRLARP